MLIIDMSMPKNCLCCNFVFRNIDGEICSCLLSEKDNFSENEFEQIANGLRPKCCKIRGEIPDEFYRRAKRYDAKR